MDQGKNNYKILITGGHSTPAFAVLDEILEKYPNTEIVWVGEKHNQRGNKNESAEFKTVTEKYKLKFINLESGKLVRKWTTKTFKKGIFELFKLAFGFIKSFFIIFNEKPDLVISFGGFTAVPIVVNAKMFRKKIVTHEQTIVAGLANKIISKFSNKIFITFEDSFKFYPKRKTILTGNPIRKDVFEIKSDVFSNLNLGLPTIYITGGNQGANQINKRVFKILNDLLKIANVVHQTGNSTVTGDFEKAKDLETKYENASKGKYVAYDYVGSENIGEFMNKSDLILSRAGANSVLEILALGKMSIFIPIPWASHNEQEKNAKFVEEQGIGKVLIQKDSLTPQVLLQNIQIALSNVESNKDFNGKDLKKSSNNAKLIVKLNAAEQVVDESFNLLVK